MNPEPSNFTYQDMLTVLARCQTIRPVCCGIVARPEVVEYLRQICQEVVTESRPYLTGLNRLYGIPVYPDHYQTEAWIPFYDEKLLRAYLRRNETKRDNEPNHPMGPRGWPDPVCGSDA